MEVRPVRPDDRSEWIRMRTALWPEFPEDHPGEIDLFFANPDDSLATFVVDRGNDRLCGLLEAGERLYAEGCLSAPVGYIEGWWVDPECRGRGYGAALVAAAEDWARGRGLTELASDADLSNELSHTAHRAVGFSEVQRLVCFRKSLR